MLLAKIDDAPDAQHFDGASVSRSRCTLSLSPVRQWPPSSSDQRLGVIWSLPIPAPLQDASGASRLRVRM